MCRDTFSIPEVTLRPVTLADIEIILRHRREMFREMGGHYAELLERFELASRSYFQIALTAGGYYGVFAELRGEVVAGGGIVIVDWPGSPLNFEPKRAWILNVYVEPLERRRGLARLIMEALIDWCRSNGFRSVALHASEDGHQVYEKLGFRGTNEMRLSL
jgi:GNAT superfamily N-acetyltransferase